jgi:membrane protein YqaA with SNARE-associated domain
MPGEFRAAQIRHTVPAALSAYASLFIAAFAAATVVPAFSEVMLGGLLLEGYDAFALGAVATAGNTAGAALNWALAVYFLRFKDRGWFPFRTHLARAQRWFQRYGVWSLLFAWLPFVGDALTFVAGLMRVNFALFLLLVALGKGSRYAVVIALVVATR